MNTLETLDFSQDINSPHSVKNFIINPTYQYKIIGLLLFTNAGNLINNLKISVRTANSIMIFNNVPAPLLTDRKVAWDESFIPIELNSQRLFLQATKNIPTNIDFSITLIYQDKTTL